MVRAYRPAYRLQTIRPLTEEEKLKLQEECNLECNLGRKNFDADFAKYKAIHNALVALKDGVGPIYKPREILKPKFNIYKSHLWLSVGRRALCRAFR